jgi:hypothetical protein
MDEHKGGKNQLKYQKYQLQCGEHTTPGLWVKTISTQEELLVEHYLVNRMGQKPRYQVQNTSCDTKSQNIQDQIRISGYQNFWKV